MKKKKKQYAYKQLNYYVVKVNGLYPRVIDGVAFLSAYDKLTRQKDGSFSCGSFDVRFRLLKTQVIRKHTNVKSKDK